MIELTIYIFVLKENKYLFCWRLWSRNFRPLASMGGHSTNLCL